MTRIRAAGTPRASTQGSNSISADSVSGLRWGALLTLALLLGLTVVLGVLYAIGHPTAEVVLAPVVMTAIVVLVIAVGSIAIVLSRLDLPNDREALGLPPGSIRAILALLLIILFLVLSLYMFGQLKSGGRFTGELQGVTSTELEQISLDQQETRVQTGGTEDEPIYTVRLRVPSSSAVDNFALQLMTTMSTLVVAVSAFYFGSKSVETAHAAGSGTRLPPASPDGTPQGAAAGSPGKFTPAGVSPPKDLAELQGGQVVADPQDAWGDDQYVNLGDGSLATWDGQQWIALRLGAVADSPGNPGKFTPPGASPPKDLADLQASQVEPDPPGAWGDGQYVKLGDDTRATWDGTAWAKAD